MNKKLFTGLSLFFFLAIFGFSQENNISLDANFGILCGNISELLYYKPYTDGVLESRLDWDVNVPYLTINVNDTLPCNLYLQGTADIGIPTDSGFMQDYDWLNYLNYNDTQLSRYSKHTNHLNYYFDLSLNAGYEFSPAHNFKLIPYGTFDYNTFFFTARDGYIQYPDVPKGAMEVWTEDLPTKECKGDIISYSQDLFEGGLGLKAVYSPAEEITFETYGSLNCIFYYIGFDYHMSPSVLTVFADEARFGMRFVYGTKSYIKFNKKLSFGVAFEGEFVPQLIGISYSQPCSKWNTWDPQNWSTCGVEQGGLTRTLYKLSLSTRYSFQFI